MKIAVKNNNIVDYLDELMHGSNRLSPYNYTGTNNPFYEPYTFYNTLCNNENTYYVYEHSSRILTASLGNTRITYTPTVMPNGLHYTLNGVFDYYPYGKILREYVQGTQEKYLTTHHACPVICGERDIETGLDYRGARFYDCDIARFLSLDPLAQKFPTMSVYMYVGANPTAFIDPNGKAILPVNEAGKQVLDASLNHFGNTFKSLLNLKTSKDGVVRSNLVSNDGEKMSYKEFKRELKKDKIEMTKSDKKAAFNLYSALHSSGTLELGVFIKSTGTNTTYDFGAKEGTYLVEKPGVSTNENYKSFSNAFDKNNATLDFVTGNKKFGMLDYKPQNANDPNPMHQGTLIINGTNETPKQSIPTLLQALTPSK